MTVAVLGVGGTIAAGASLAGTGVGIAADVGAFGGSGGGGGGGTGPAPYLPLSPASNYLGSLFGQAYIPQLGWSPINQFGQFAGPGLFGPGTTSTLQNYLNQPAVGLNQYQTGLPQQLLQQAFKTEQTGQGGPLAGIIPGIDQLAQTGGYPELAKQLQNQFFTYQLPQLAEQFGGTTGINSSDFGRNATQQLTSADVALAAQSVQNRLAAAPLASALTSANISIPTSLASDLAQYGTGLQTAEQQVQNLPGQRILGTLNQLQGAASGLPYTQQGFSPFGSGNAQTAAALAGAIPGIGQNIGNLASLFGGGGGSAGGGYTLPASTSSDFMVAGTGGGNSSGLFGGGGGTGFGSASEAGATGYTVNPYSAPV